VVYGFVFGGVGVLRVEGGLCREAIAAKRACNDCPPFEHLEEANRGSKAEEVLDTVR